MKLRIFAIVLVFLFMNSVIAKAVSHDENKIAFLFSKENKQEAPQNVNEYLDVMYSKIVSKWKAPQRNYVYSVHTKFKIQKDGSITDIKIIKFGNDMEINNSVVVTFKKISPLKPLTADVKEDFIDAEYVFTNKQ